MSIQDAGIRAAAAQTIRSGCTKAHGGRRIFRNLLSALRNQFWRSELIVHGLRLQFRRGLCRIRTLRLVGRLVVSSRLLFVGCQRFVLSEWFTCRRLRRLRLLLSIGCYRNWLNRWLRHGLRSEMKQRDHEQKQNRTGANSSNGHPLLFCRLLLRRLLLSLIFDYPSMNTTGREPGQPRDSMSPWVWVSHVFHPP